MKFLNSRIAIISIGYVILPLSVKLTLKFLTDAFVISVANLSELNKGIYFTLVLESDDLKSVLSPNMPKYNRSRDGLLLITDITDISKCNVYIVTVPKPIDEGERQVLPFISASTTIEKSTGKKNAYLHGFII